MSANRYLRMALYMPALSAARHDPEVRAFYHYLIEARGLKKLQAVCAVMRKHLLAVHAMLRTRSPFDGSRFFAACRSVGAGLPRTYRLGAPWCRWISRR